MVLLAGGAFAVSAGALAGCGSILHAGDYTTSDDVVGGDAGDSDAGPIVLGMSAAFTGTSGNLGTEMRRGIGAYLNAVNTAGGIRGGRQVTLDALDDAYTPATAVLNTETLLDMPQQPLNADGTVPMTPTMVGPTSVFAIIGNVGTPTMVDTFPIITGADTIFFAPFTGSQKYLRDGTDSPYSFNFRAGYYDETQAMIDYFFTTRSPQIPSYENIIVFAQGDTYGDAGYAGLIAGYKASGRSPALPSDTAITRINYTRDDLTSVAPAVQQTTATTLPSGLTYNLESLYQTATRTATTVPVAIVMVDTYAIGAQYIKGIKDYINQDTAHASALDVTFINISFVGPDDLANELKTLGTYSAPGGSGAYSTGVMVSEVVPFYNSQSAGTTQYRTDIKNFDQGSSTEISLEGYLAAELFVEGLKGATAVTSSALITELESMSSIDLGIGVTLSFSSTNHSASHNVWLSTMDANATFTFPYRWDPTDKVIPN